MWPLNIWLCLMLVIVSMSRLDNDRIEIRVARPQHDSNFMRAYQSEKEARVVLSDFGISEGAIDCHVKLLRRVAAMIFDPVSWWVFGHARNAALDSPVSGYPVCASCPIAQAPAERYPGLFPFPLAHKRSARDAPDTQT